MRPRYEFCKKAKTGVRHIYSKVTQGTRTRQNNPNQTCAAKTVAGRRE